MIKKAAVYTASALFATHFLRKTALRGVCSAAVAQGSEVQGGSTMKVAVIGTFMCVCART